jgi:SNF2 family DNA or RNA helicase
VPALAVDSDTKLYLASILHMNYDGRYQYFYANQGDIIQQAIMIRKIQGYFDRIGFPCQLDTEAKKIMEKLINSENELRDSATNGTEIKLNPQNAPTIPGFIRTLKPYQITPVNHAFAGYYVANFSVPGSGKTTVAYATYALLKASSTVQKIMVIGPRSSFMPWEEEYESCFGNKPRSFRIVGKNQSLLEEQATNNELFLLTYQMASNIVPKLTKILSKFEYLLILDEAHHVKGTGLWSNAVRKVAPYAKRRLILTGTPMPNNLNDLWSQFTFLWPFKNLLGEFSAYKEIANQNDGLMRVRERINPFYTRVTKKQLNLPEPSYQVITVPLGRVQAAIYSALAVRTLKEMSDSPADKDRLREWKKAKVIRLMQAASNPSLLAEYSEEFKVPPIQAEGLPVVRLIERYSDFEIPSKLVKVEKMAREFADNNEKVIVWTTFVKNIKTLGNMLQDKKPILIYGDIPKDENEDELVNREKLIHDFKTDPTLRVLIANPNSLAESVSLHKICKKAIYVDRTFNAGQYIQSLDRIHRIGLEAGDKVVYYLLMARDTIDEAIDTRLSDKFDRMLQILNDDVQVADFDIALSDESEDEFEKDFQEVHKHLLKSKTGEQSDT